MPMNQRTLRPMAAGMQAGTPASLLLHFDGANNSTTFTDSSPNALTVTAHGNAAISTSQSKFGGASAYFDGVDSYLSVPVSENLEFGTDDFTVEAWIHPLDFANGRIVGIGNGANNGGPYTGWSFRLDLIGRLQFYRYDGSDEIFSDYTESVPLNAWTHVAVSRHSGVIRVFINGTVASENTMTNSFDRINNDGLQVGKVAFGGTDNYANLYIDELRIVKSAIYESNFTPPTGPLSAYV